MNFIQIVQHICCAFRWVSLPTFTEHPHSRLPQESPGPPGSQHPLLVPKRLCWCCYPRAEARATAGSRHGAKNARSEKKVWNVEFILDFDNANWLWFCEARILLSDVDAEKTVVWSVLDLEQLKNNKRLVLTWTSRQKHHQGVSFTEFTGDVGVHSRRLLPLTEIKASAIHQDLETTTSEWIK